MNKSKCSGLISFAKNIGKPFLQNHLKQETYVTLYEILFDDR